MLGTLLVARDAEARQRGEAPTTVRSGSARYRAVVRDWSGRPVQNARARILGHRFALTDEGGSVVLDSLPAGPQTLEVLAVGYFPDRRLVEVSSERALADTIILTALQSALDTVRVTAGRGVSGFDARRRGTVGQFITAADIERENPRNTTSLLRTRDGLRYTFDRTGKGLIQMTAGPGRACKPMIWVDGFKATPVPTVAGLAGLNWTLHPEGIGGVEIYNNPAMVPAQFVDPEELARNGRLTCGTIVFWTREKLGMKAPRTAPP
jgi:hypothetical protein